MSARVCSNCGAPLPLAAPGAVERCPFCGTEAREDGAPSATAESTQAGTSPSGCNLVVALIAVVVGVIAVAATVVNSCQNQLSVSKLATTSLANEHDLDAPKIVGSYGSFDVVANVGWAKRIGAAWRPDAVLDTIDVSGMKKDGTVDLVHGFDDEVQYTFVSPRCIASGGATGCELRLKLERDKSVTVISSRPSDTVAGGPDIDAACTLPRAMAALEAAGKLPAQSAYGAHYTKEKHNRPSWDFDSDSETKIPAVDAETCTIER